MKLVLILSICLCLLSATGCAGKKQTDAREPSVSAEETLEKVFEPVTDGMGFPLELVNMLGKAVYEGDTGPVIRALDDRSLRLTEETMFALTKNSVRLRDNEEVFYYRYDSGGNGIDEIYFISRGDDLYAGYVERYVKSGNDYVYNGTKFIGGIENLAVFQYENQLYLAADVSGNLFGDVDIRLCRISDLFQDKIDSQLYILRNYEICNLQQMSENTDFPDLTNVQVYVDEIVNDLMEVSSNYGTFYGDEKEREDLRSSWIGKELDLENLYAVDADNDGDDEYFERKTEWFSNGDGGAGGDILTTLDWYNKDMEPSPQPIASPWPVALQVDDSYARRQVWFKIFGEKTVVFSLYHNMDSRNQYVIDARIFEGGEAIILLDYTFAYEKAGISLAYREEQWEYGGSSVYIYCDDCYHDPDVKKAFPENLETLAKDLKMRTPDKFSFEESNCDSVPWDLLVFIKEKLSNGADLGDSVESYSARLDKSDFLNEYEEFVEGCGIGSSDDRIEYVYQYDIAGTTYFLAPSGYPGPTSIGYTLFRKEGKGLKVYGYYSVPDMVPVMKCSGELYLLEPADAVFDPLDTKRQRYLYTINIHKLAPEQEKNFAAVKAFLLGYQWEKIYDNHGEYENTITEYLEQIKDSLMETADLELGAAAYTGDEQSIFDSTKLQRLKSMEGEERQQFYEIDFDNDGVPEYFSKYNRIGYGTMIFNSYRFENNRTVCLNYDVRDEENYLSQIWFKKLDDKIFTFKMIAKNEYYLLNISLVEGKVVTQLQSYIIIPKREYRLIGE